MDSDKFFFAQPEQTSPSQETKYWEILVVDDEKDVHDVTSLVLGNNRFLDHKLRFSHAYSAKEAKEMFLNGPEFAVILLDVVMETRQAGLELANWIRNDFGDKHCRIILRTGQPGDAPEEKVILNYDINDYKTKTELTSTRLLTAIYSAIRSYSDIVTIEQTRDGLKTIIDSTSNILVADTSTTWLKGILLQIVALLKLNDACAIHFGASQIDGEWTIVASTDESKIPIGKELADFIDHSDIPDIHPTSQLIELSATRFALPIEIHHSKGIIVINCSRYVIEQRRELIELLVKNASIAYEKLYLLNDMLETQKEIAYRLGEVVETRSKESGSHVKRLSLLSHLLALEAGLDEQTAERIKLASPLHDIGKIAIPDSILHKPGKLSEQEWETMKSHASIGGVILSGSHLEILQIAAVIASTHHEKWDGTGYPKQLKGEDIPIEGRITAIIDVFDALASKRSYKQPWSNEEIYQHIKDQRGIHFDPHLCDVFLRIFDKCVALRDSYPD
ncbi:HD domain-containing phosphohydrolase [Vibrio atypicus]|uniref:HD domain-containing phosphohydrolase n=1 Tax=Vibrio atypicus TaxID=558271 RepID=UPI003735E37A